MQLYFSAPFSILITMVKPLKKSRHPEAPAPAAEPAAREAPRRETADTAADLGAADRRGVRS